MRRRDPTLQRWLENQAAEILGRLPALGDFPGEVCRVLARPVGSGDTRIESVAKLFATTPRALQRRLAEAGTSYEALCDRARKQAAETHSPTQAARPHES
jgi:hypothetical protein